MPPVSKMRKRESCEVDFIPASVLDIKGYDEGWSPPGKGAVPGGTNPTLILKWWECEERTVSNLCPTNILTIKKRDATSKGLRNQLR